MKIWALRIKISPVVLALSIAFGCVAMLLLSQVFADSVVVLPRPEKQSAASQSQPSGVLSTSSGARQILQKMGAYLAQCRTVRVNITSAARAKEAGSNIEWEATYRVLLKRPNLFLVVPTHGPRLLAQTYACEGQTLTVYSPSDKVYQIFNAPKSPADMYSKGYKGHAVGILEWGFVWVLAPAADRLILDLEDVVTDEQVEYLGLMSLKNGIACYQIGLTNEYRRVLLWIAAGPRPLPMRVEYRFNRQQEALPNDGESTNTITFDDWATNIEIPDVAFRFVPPDGARESQ